MRSSQNPSKSWYIRNSYDCRSSIMCDTCPSCGWSCQWSSAQLHHALIEENQSSATEANAVMPDTRVLTMKHSNTMRLRDHSESSRDSTRHGRRRLQQWYGNELLEWLRLCIWSVDQDAATKGGNRDYLYTMMFTVIWIGLYRDIILRVFMDSPLLSNCLLFGHPR